MTTTAWSQIPANQSFQFLDGIFATQRWKILAFLSPFLSPPFIHNHFYISTPETIKAQSAFYSPLGEAKISPIDTRDISAVAAKALVESGHEGKRYDLTGGESFSNAEIAELLSKALG